MGPAYTFISRPAVAGLGNPGVQVVEFQHRLPGSAGIGRRRELRHRIGRARERGSGVGRRGSGGAGGRPIRQ